MTTPITNTEIRPLASGDIEQVRLLWGTNVLDDLEILSYDRWGPGVAVPARTDVAEVKVQTLDPKEGMTRLLEHLLTAEDAFCLVSAEGDDVHGYVVAGIHDQGVNDFRSGRIDELYVREDRRRRGIATRLVRAALSELRNRDAWVFKVEVNKTWQHGRRFWDAQRWEQDAVVYRLYD
ncbi:GNAT family N-acetyltransferase [Rhizohabitans arisaemae]|uniref:GNAT family N-acetyltransferase n=1 Tax=Rhizohabitans arisaemae TaxID=2720610 RepID=UPI0024B1A0C3|nr:GNAT family N-acetyltransferase [Rhizohabitans arisaemae]